MASLKGDSSRQMIKDQTINNYSELTKPDNRTDIQTGNSSNEIHAAHDSLETIPPIHAENKAATAWVPATHTNLAEFERQQVNFWADPARVTKMRQEQSRKVREALESLGVDLSVVTLEDMGRSFDGMTPMERFVNSKNNS